MAKKKSADVDRPEGLRPDRGITLVTVETLKVLISLSGMNQKQLAEACHMSESQVSEYLSGETALGKTAIAKFSIGLKVSPELLARAEGISLEDVKRKILADIAVGREGAQSKLSTPAYLTRLMRRFKVVSPGELQDAINVARKLAGRDQRSIQNVLIPTDAEVDEICSMHRVKREDVAQIPREDLLQKLLGKPPGGSW